MILGTLSLTLATKLLFMCTSASESVEGLIFQKEYCTTVADATTRLSFTTVSSRSGCAVMCIPPCVSFLVSEVSVGSVFQCALLSDTLDLPASTDCTDVAATVGVYIDLDCPVKSPWPECTSDCDAERVVGGTKYCLRNRYSRQTQPAARATCQAEGGDIAEAETLDDVAFLRQFVSVTERTWVGADDSKTLGTYVWFSGRGVSSALFCGTEPNQAFERCLTTNRYGDCLMDFKCEGVSYPFACALPCK
ncbi:uncharacterized protein LOC118478280 [Aplysia californica]|uniref:Uncharacterized protein LOC118478280 n=1 Tax=Aplysia californica TaxID=6500 RepID=A0ABM1VYG1_APLCA|nr:uncharacterized protein LOC118478280 [Aplysia californica]